MVDYVLKYGTGNLIILYCYTYSGLSSIAGNFVWNSMRLMRSIGTGPWVTGFEMEYNLCLESGKYTDVGWYVILVEST